MTFFDVFDNDFIITVKAVRKVVIIIFTFKIIGFIGGDNAWRSKLSSLQIPYFRIRRTRRLIIWYINGNNFEM